MTWREEDLVSACIFGSLGLFIVGLIAFAIADDNRTEKLRAQCLADGHKDYECEALLRRNDPVIIYQAH